MQTPPTIRFRGLRATDGLVADVRARLNKLETYYPSLIGAGILVEPVQQSHRAGNRYHVRIDLRVPGEDIVVSHEPHPRPRASAAAARRLRKSDETDPERKLLGVAIREAFAVARRRLQDYVRRRRGV